MQFATNHLGHFTLTTGLHDALAAAARTAGQARVVSVSSSAHLGSGIVFDDIHFRMRAATGSTAVTWKTPQQGATTSVLLAVSPLLDGSGGKYFEDCNEALPNEPGTRRGVAAYALDPEAASRLWQVSAESVGT